ncbi:MAG: carboxypeptidase regulatory-like domain-containing protein [bacterium]
MKRTILILGLICLFIISACNENNPVSPIQKGFISGQVTDYTTGQPIANVLVTTCPSSRTALTDNNGRFILENITTGEYRLIAEKNEFSPSSSKVSVLSNDTTDIAVPMKLSLNKYGLLYGLLTDEKSSPLDSVEVIISDGAETIADTITDSKGFYSIALPFGKYYVTLSKSNYQPVDKDVEVLKNQAINLNVVLIKTEIEIPIPSKSELYVYYSFNVDPGTTNVTDNSANGFNGTLMNKDCVYETGKFGNCIRLIGKPGITGCWIKLPCAMNLPEFTVNMWVKEISSNWGSGQAYFQAGNNSNSVCLIARNAFFSIVSNTSELDYNFAVGAINTSGASNTPITLADNGYDPYAWNMFTLVYKKEGLMDAYINAKLVGSKNQAFNINPSGNIGINVQWWSGDGATRLTACYDEFRIDKSALSTTKIERLYKENKY